METAIAFKIASLSILSFLLALIFQPIMTYFLHKYKMGKQIREAKDAPIFASMHESKKGTPTMGGLMIWLPVVFLAIVFFLIEKFFPNTLTGKLDFLTREQTLLPLGALILSALIGLLDDYLGIKKIGPKGGGLSMKHRLGLYTLIAIVCALWFYFKLDWDVVHIPFVGNFEFGFWYLPFFIFVIVASAFSVNETDGLDGLAGGTMASAFATLGAISFLQGKFDLAVFCGAIMGALIAFLWFNINPAKFFMGDTGAMSLGVTIGIIAMLTNTAFLLPIFGLIFVIESLSVIIQITSKKIRHKKLFLSAPIHHHLQAIGWSEPRIVMRFWLVSSIFSVIGLIIFILDKGWY
ncbi:MAG: phospho-N-acetylmuramoyl-pentapeptide-transferase [Patescibacteria group bacterium]